MFEHGNPLGDFEEYKEIRESESRKRNDVAEQLETVFDHLPPIAKEVIVNGRNPFNANGNRTLEDIGAENGLTRERIRQIKIKGIERLTFTLNELMPFWESDLKQHLETFTVANARNFAESLCMPPAGLAFTLIMFETVGWEPLPSNHDYWVPDTQEFLAQLNAFTPTQPLTENEWQELGNNLKIPLDFLETYPFPREGRMIRFGENRIRESAQRADQITLFLRESGEADMKEIVSHLKEDAEPNAIREYMRRRPEFTQNPVTGKWGITGQIDVFDYDNSRDAVFHLLGTEGPISFKNLSRRMTEIYPVTAWRVKQILDDFRVGTMPSGEYWLIEHGAQREPENTPTKPGNMMFVHNTIGVSIKVNHDYVRGSGSLHNRWLSWKLGLKASPFDITFTDPEAYELVITRMGGSASIGSLAKPISQQGLSIGCQTVLVLETEAQSWELRHTCQPQQCPSSPQAE